MMWSYTSIYQTTGLWLPVIPTKRAYIIFHNMKFDDRINPVSNNGGVIVSFPFFVLIYRLR
jgi:hypothetical protein